MARRVVALYVRDTAVDCSQSAINSWRPPGYPTNLVVIADRRVVRAMVFRADSCSWSLLHRPSVVQPTYSPTDCAFADLSAQLQRLSK